MSNKITNREAFDLAAKLNEPDILGIKDTEFALAVYKNLKVIVDEYNKIQETLKPSKAWTELTKDAETEEDFNLIKEDKENEKIFAIREKQIAKYNKLLEKQFNGLIVSVKINNLKTRLSATDIMSLEPMLTI